MTRRSLPLVLAALALVLLVAPVKASDPMGAYCLIEKVVFEPNDGRDRAQIWGACALAIPQPGGEFQKPARGYFYYSIPKGQEDTVRAEWTDLKGMAGKDEAVGFGSRYRPLGRFRPGSEAVAKPDVYPLNTGVVKLGTYGPVPPDLLQQLRQALRGR
ncbi:MAG: hypothetical protein ACHQO8_14025 [Vicinamibacterales bacterium]